MPYAATSWKPHAAALDRMLAALDEAEKEEGGPGDGEEPPAA